MAIQQTLADKSKKQPKPKRSLRKKPLLRTPVSEQKDLAIDISKPELDAIFTNLYLGNLSNPQMALGMVYSLALDALEKTLIQGVDELLHSVADSKPALSNNNPFAPWLNQFKPSDPDKINAFKNSLAQKIGNAKKTIQNRINQAYEADAKGNNIIGEKHHSTAEAVRAFLQDPLAEIELPALETHLSKDRLQELFKEIQLPIPDDGIKRFHISQTPGHYRFSFGGIPASKKHTDSVHIDSNEQTSDSVTSSDNSDADSSIDNDDNSQQIAETDSEKSKFYTIQPVTNNNENSDVSSISTSDNETHPSAIYDDNAAIIETNPDSTHEQTNNVSIQLTPEKLQEVLGIDKAQTEALTSNALDAFHMATEVSEAMKAIAIQIAQATIDAYRHNEFPISLTEALKDDPRLQQDAELTAFVELLDAPESSPDEESETIDNDELASAFGKLLDNLDF